MFDVLTRVYNNNSLKISYYNHFNAGTFSHTIDAPCTPGEIRLANGTLKSEGRVEICFDGVWGTTCGSYWIEVDSIVVCRQLGYNDYSK